MIQTKGTAKNQVLLRGLQRGTEDYNVVHRITMGYGGYREVLRGIKIYQGVPRGTEGHKEVARVIKSYQGVPTGTGTKGYR